MMLETKELFPPPFFVKQVNLMRLETKECLQEQFLFIFCRNCKCKDVLMKPLTLNKNPQTKESQKATFSIRPSLHFLINYQVKVAGVLTQKLRRCPCRPLANRTATFQRSITHKNDSRDTREMLQNFLRNCYRIDYAVKDD